MHSVAHGPHFLEKRMKSSIIWANQETHSGSLRAEAYMSKTQVLRWRYCDVTYEGVTDHRDALLPTALWHWRKRSC